MRILLKFGWAILFILFINWLLIDPKSKLILIVISSPFWGLFLYSLRDYVFPSLVKRAKDGEFATQPAHTIPATISDLPLLAEIDSDDSSLRVKLLSDSPNKNGWIELENNLKIWNELEHNLQLRIQRNKLDYLFKDTKEYLIEINKEKPAVYNESYKYKAIARYMGKNIYGTKWEDKQIKSDQKYKFYCQSRVIGEFNDYFDEFKLETA